VEPYVVAADVYTNPRPGFELHYRHRETVYHIHVINRGGKVSRVVCDGAEQANLRIPLRDDRQDHHVEIELAGG
jgi:cellobiose phosphorylase